MGEDRSVTLAIEECPSPNQGERTSGPVDILLLHYTGMPSSEQALAWLCNPQSQVSSHYFVFEDGRIELAGTAQELAQDPQVQRAYLGVV